MLVLGLGLALRTINAGLGLRTYGLGLVIKALALTLKQLGASAPTTEFHKNPYPYLPHSNIRRMTLQFFQRLSLLDIMKFPVTK